MIDAGEPGAVPARKSRRRNRAFAVAGTVAVLAVAWLSEVPQERLADWGLEKFLGTGVQVEWGGALGALRIDSLRLFETVAESGPPVVELTGLEIDYTLFPGDGRRIPAVTVDSVEARLDATDSERPNFAFIESLLQSGGDPPPDSIVPKRISIANISLNAVGTPPGEIAGEPIKPIGLRLSGLNAQIELSGAHVTTAKIIGTNVRSRIWVGNVQDAVDNESGRVEVAFVGDATQSRFDTVRIELPGLMEVHGTARIEMAESGNKTNARFGTFKLFGEQFHDDSLPFSIAVIDASGAILDANATSSVPVSIASLRVGSVEQPLYDGNLTLALSREPERAIELTATLSEGQALNAEVDPWAGSVLAAIDAWTPEMLENATPPAYRDRLAELPAFQTFSVTVAASAPKAAEWLDGNLANLPFDFSIFGGAELPESAKDEGLRVEAAGSGTWSNAGLDSAHVQGGIVIAGERAAFDIDTSEEKAFASGMQFEDVRVGRWLKLALGDIPLGTDSGLLNGSLAYDGETGQAELSLSRGGESAAMTMTIDGGTGGEAMHVKVNAQSGGTAEFVYDASGEDMNGTLAFEDFDLGRLARLAAYEADLHGTGTGEVRFTSNAEVATGELSARLDGVRSDDWSLNPNAPIEVAVAFEADPEFNTAQGESGTVKLDGESILMLGPWSWTREPFLFTGEVTAELDLAKHGPAIGVEGWGGNAKAAFAMRHENHRWRAPARVEWTDPRIPGLEDLYAGPITFAGEVSRQPDATATTVRNGEVQWGEHTRVGLPNVAVETSPFGVLGEVAIESDMTVLVALGLLQYVDAAMVAQGEVRLVDGNPQFDLMVDAEMASLQLPDGMAVATDAKLSGQLTYGNGYGGTGVFNAANAASAGALLTGISGGYEFTGDRLHLSEVTGQLYGGDVLGKGQIELLTGTYNSEFNAGITRLNLDRFTKEFQPGEFRLTGIADGDVYARWSTNGLSGARFFMTSTEDFSLDRETVETLLTTSAIPDQWGMRWIRNRINKKMIGTEPQRPFDSARVELTLRDDDTGPGQLLGPITLKSETLDMNIEWAIDVDAIYAAMESDLTAVENISTGAVQSDNQ